MGTEDNTHPRCFWQADLDEAAGRLVRIVRGVRADVILGPNSFGGDGHPDHIRASRVAALAFERSGSPDAYREQLAASALEPRAPAKLYHPLNQLGCGEEM